MAFGGSWGSTLALAYAQTHPDRVTELVLRGIFTFRQTELDWLYQYGASEVFPDKWAEFLAPIPEDERGDLVAAYHRRLTGDDPAVRLAAAKAWSKWEAETVTLLPNPHVIEEYHQRRFRDRDRPDRKSLHDQQGLARRRPADPRRGEAARHPRRHRSGPPRLLHAACRGLGPASGLAEAELNIVPDGGHLFNEPGILDGLIRATDRFAGD